MKKSKPAVFLIFGLTFFFGQIKADFNNQFYVNEIFPSYVRNSKYLNDTLIDSPQKTYSDLRGYDLYLIGATNLSKQIITVGNYTSNFIYSLDEISSDTYNSGFMTGLRLDSKMKKRSNYSLEIGLSKMNPGSKYDGGDNLYPFMGNFSKFKAENQFFTFSSSLHLRQLLNFRINTKEKIFFVLGPSIETRLSGQTNDNLINRNYRLFNVRADIGLEFFNNSFFILFAHYKYGLTSFTKLPVITNLNSFNLGISVNTKNIFKKYN